jgi:hypothetical protein
MVRLLAKLGIPWPYATRTIGAVMVGYGMFFDDSAERGTIILAGVGFLGYEFVQRSEPKPPKKDDPSKENGTG